MTLTDDPAVARAADLLVLPGSRATTDDLAWLRGRRLDVAITERHADGRPVLGICGGYQMLAETIQDQVESTAGRVPGLGVLPVAVRFGAEKVTRQASHAWRGHQVHGYEIHHGICARTGQAKPFLDGWQLGSTYGTMLHGSLENDDFRLALLAEVASATESGWLPDPDAVGYAAAREQMINTLADAIEEHADLDRLVELAAGGPFEARTSASVAVERQAGVQSRSECLEAAPATRRRPLLIVHTGDGKGKSTAAFGMGLRAWAQGQSIGVHQFIKAGKWPTGERLAYQALAGVHARTGQGGPIEWRNWGAGRTDTRAGRDLDHAGLAREGWLVVREQLAAQTHDLTILDEFAHVLAKGWIDVDEVLAALTSRPGIQQVVITGRGAPPELIAAADLVSEVRKVKHPYDRGMRAQPGIEW